MADGQGGAPTDSCSPIELLSRLDQLGERLSCCDLTFAIVAGVSQGFSALQRLLERRTGDRRPLLNRALQGLGTVISGQQIVRLAECADIVREDLIASQFFHADPWESTLFRTKLAGTRFLHAFDDYLAEYGHRAVAESDVMSPRFFEVPGEVLDVVRAHVKGASPMRDIRGRQSEAQEHALDRMRSAFRWRYHEWACARWWHARLSRFLALREANRHHLMYYICRATASSMMGRHFTSDGVLNQPDDIFFLVHDDIKQMVSGDSQNWKAVVASRRAERLRNTTQPALISSWSMDRRYDQRTNPHYRPGLYFMHSQSAPALCLGGFGSFAPRRISETFSEETLWSRLSSIRAWFHCLAWPEDSSQRWEAFFRMGPSSRGNMAFPPWRIFLESHDSYKTANTSPSMPTQDT